MTFLHTELVHVPEYNHPVMVTKKKTYQKGEVNGKNTLKEGNNWVEECPCLVGIQLITPYSKHRMVQLQITRHMW